MTFVALGVILLLQSIWIANAFHLLQKQLYQELNKIVNLSVNKELNHRMELDTTTDAVIGTIESDTTTGVLTSHELIFQDYLYNKSLFISLFDLDSIFRSEITKQNIHNKFIINRVNPQTGEILETTDPRKTGKLRGAMLSDIVPIRINGSEGVQALLVSPYRAIFGQMLLILLLSLLMVLFLSYVFFFVLSSFIKEKRLRQFQTDFSHALVHNMSTPLGTIAQINNQMKNNKFITDTEKRNQNISIVQQEIVNLQALTDRILTIAHGEQSRLVPKLEQIEITKEIEDLIQIFSIQSKKEIIFSTHFHPQRINIQADRAMLTNVISNLIDNAIKYSNNPVQIDIECRLSKAGLLISIKDNGYGISKKDQQVIFSKFERGDAVTRQEAKGFGLGLAYVKNVVDAHGGTVNLFSTKGEGSTFELFLPVFGPDTPFPIQFNTERS